MNPLKALSMIRRVGETPSKKPFYSAVDKAIDEIVKKQPKGTGDQYLSMILKTKGVKPAEVKDRGIDVALKNKGKVSGADLQKIADENPPPDITQKTLKSDPIPSYDDLLDMESKGYRTGDFSEYNEAKELIDLQESGVYGEFAPGETKYGEYATPGGKNYREILFKVPGKQAYKSAHFDNHGENLMAHARVQDMTGPNGEKIMLIDEIQSDWHQAGRDKGYKVEGGRTAEDAERELSEINKKRSRLIDEAAALPDSEMNLFKKLNAEIKALGIKATELSEEWNTLVNKPEGVPDAPFKKNWHELVVKRLVDDAAKGGYDRVIITPGAEQAKRYDLSSHVDKLVYNDNSQYLMAIKNGEHKLLEKVPPEKLPEYIGQEMADKLLAQTPIESKRIGETTERILSGVDLEVGGEGMKGFYDKILPSYIKKQYGVEIGQHPLRLRDFEVVRENRGEGFAVVRPGGGTVAKYPTMEEAQAAADQLMNVPYHSFDITPEMRESIINKGQPLYQMAPVGVGAAVANEESFEYRKGGHVKSAPSLDAMRLAVIKRK